MSGEVYDPANTKLVWGAIGISGFAEGTMIEVEPGGEGNKVQVGTAGEAAYVKDRNRSAKVKFRVMETARAVMVQLSAAYQIGNIPAPLGIIDLSTGMKGGAASAMLERWPGVTKDNGVPVREFVLVCAIYEEVVTPV